MANLLTIGKLAKRADSMVQTVRYYEKIGLMPEPVRSAGNQRLYTRAHLQRLLFIRHSRDLGFTLDSIRQLLDLAEDPEHTCAEADSIARVHLKQVESRIQRLKLLQEELERMIHHCAGEKISNCRIIEVLSNHALCSQQHEVDG